MLSIFFLLIKNFTSYLFTAKHFRCLVAQHLLPPIVLHAVRLSSCLSHLSSSDPHESNLLLLLWLLGTRSARSWCWLKRQLHKTTIQNRRGDISMEDHNQASCCKKILFISK
ncbi:hypothetical protein BS78_05G261300 [Paspalum vaginatum]|nr:hypothetical protein BS78_05G261300 [Paspalum vaginatum]